MQIYVQKKFVDCEYFNHDLTLLLLSIQTTNRIVKILQKENIRFQSFTQFRRDQAIIDYLVSLI